MSQRKVVELRSVATIVQGGRHKLSGHDFVSEGGYPAYGAGGINGYLPIAEFNREAVILSSIGARCGKCFLAKGRWSSLANTQLILTDEDQVDATFLWYHLNDEKRWPRAGVAQPFIKPSDVKAHKISLPPLEEQKRIAAILDQADDLRRKRQHAIDRLNQLGQAIFHEMFGDPATNPKGFEPLPLGKIIDFIGGAQPAKSHFLYEDGPDRVRFVQIRDFRTDKYPTYVPKGLAKRPFAEDDVMIGRYGPPVFQIFRGLSGTYNVALMKAQPKSYLNSDFVFYLLQEKKLHSYVVSNSERTAGQSGVNLDLLEKYPAYSPPEELIQEFSRRLKTLDRQLNGSRAATDSCEALFASLQHRAFSGEL